MNESSTRSFDSAESLGIHDCHPSVTGSSDRFFSCIAVGRQSVTKQLHLSDPALNVEVLVVLAVIRLPQVSSDIVLSLTSPLDHTDQDNDESRKCKDCVLEILRSFEIQDWGLFTSNERV
ncbi:hypothetical protein CEUSTIGMA_g614.t1 [Chlamydomonas eustigma]|uniref:Uncharacterized protein n=1 Tax=Chlamydomonas eustigma TaxID=1157962 RepID=A0A250WQT9_9CHLO|nr:hypothetical protein CEUSTIGMA_g614.t1 [Chlamydomonas eustigma]|eukprot:GAX73161.1 hypothetical protein CEUSTIGMA_g614.t1 [Chlamydomonas eustigma]